MSSRILVGLIIGVLVVHTAYAQTLEETYANLCSDNAAAKSETCSALRQALIGKLQAQTTGAASSVATPRAEPLPGAVPPPQSTSMAAVAPTTGPSPETLALWHKRWGFYADMVGKSWQSAEYPEYISTYGWKTPGEELEIRTGGPDGKVIVTIAMRWDESRQAMVTNVSGNESYSAVQPDGSIEATGKPGTPTAEYRGVTRQRPDGAIESISYKRKGRDWELFSHTLTSEYRPGGPPSLAATPNRSSAAR